MLRGAWDRAMRSMSATAVATGEAVWATMRKYRLMAKLTHRLAPTEVARRLLAPPAAPTHVPQAVHRMWAFHAAMPESTRMHVTWQNARSAAEAAVSAHPDDARIRKHRDEVVTTYSAIFS